MQNQLSHSLRTNPYAITNSKFLSVKAISTQRWNIRLGYNEYHPTGCPWETGLRIFFFNWKCVAELYIKPNYPNSFAFMRMFRCPDGQKKSKCPTLLYTKVITATEMKHQTDHLMIWWVCTRAQTCDILAAERIRLMRFDNRLIIEHLRC